MKKAQKISAIILSAALFCTTALSMTGCSKGGGDQLSKPVKGDTVATISIEGFGDVKVKLFPKEAPKAVENFTTHAKNGYYNGLTFHRVMNEFMIQGGDPDGVGTGGESIWGEAFEDEFSDKLHNFTGALSMANSGPNTNGSQFFLVKTSPITDTVDANGQTVTADQMLDYFAKQIGKEIPDEVRKSYKEIGGTPWLDGLHTVFGQIYEGLDIVQKVMDIEVDVNDMPTEPVVIKSIEISTIE